MPATTAPNILWICTDQQRWDTIHALGNPHINTPNLDRLAAEGVAFTRAYSQSPICTPSRASFLTGCYPSRVHNCSNGNDRWSEAAPLVTQLLRDGAGYDCGLAGKFHLAGACGRVEPRPEDDGYRVFHWSHHPKNDWPEGHAYADWLRAKGFDPDRVGSEPEKVPPELHQSSWCAEMAIAFMNEAREGPWLFSYNCFDPHAPFDPPQEYLDRYDWEDLPPAPFRPGDLKNQAALDAVDFQNEARDPESFDVRKIKGAYYAMIELIDHNVGRMLDALDASGQRDNTIVIFMSDHGETLGDHGLLLKGCRFYESLVHVPLIMRRPGHFDFNARRDALVELTDLVPTLLEAAGVPIPDHVQGRTLLPYLTGKAHPNPRDVVRSEYYHALTPRKMSDDDHFVEIRNPESRGARVLPGSDGTMLFDGRYKLSVYHGHDTGELYDLENDPGEFDNLWDDPAHAEIRFKLLKRSFDELALALDRSTPQLHQY